MMTGHVRFPSDFRDFREGLHADQAPEHEGDALAMLTMTIIQTVGAVSIFSIGRVSSVYEQRSDDDGVTGSPGSERQHRDEGAADGPLFWGRFGGDDHFEGPFAEGPRRMFRGRFA
jgi:hypothetical protein